MLNGSKIKVGFTKIGSKEWIGGINYFKNLFTALKEYSNIEPVVFLNKNENNSDLIKDFTNISTIVETKTLFNEKSVLNKLNRKTVKFFSRSWFYDKYFEKHDIKIISHSNFYDEKSILKKINWIPDFQYLHLPEMFTEEEIKVRNYHNRKMVENSAIIILSSQDAFNDFKNFAPEHTDKVRILHFVAAPNSQIFINDAEYKKQILLKYELPEKFFYIPNQFWKHKNHKIVFKAVNILKQQGLDIKVVCTGNLYDYRSPDHFDNLQNYIQQNNLYDNIGFVNYNEVLFFMRNCISLINPSLFEGWNTMVEEAKSMGKQIILSDLPVHREQNPSDATYFNPENSEHLAEILKDKWQNSVYGSNFELEKTAKEQLPHRIKEFAQTYEKYVKKLVIS